jgi:eukaryotic-like serine/threonine-protein kinase
LTTLGRSRSFWPLLKISEDPRTRTDLIAWMGRFGLDPTELIRQLRVEKDSSILQALLLGLGGYEEYVLPQSRRKALIAELLTMYRNDPDPGVHSAIEWLLVRWGFKGRLDPIVTELRETSRISRNLRWFVNRHGETMVIVPKSYEFLMGSPIGEARRNETEEQHVRRIERTFAIGSKEVTVHQFLEVFPEKERVYDKVFSPSSDCPINKITWFDAARYCRRLSDLEHIPESEMCYPSVDKIGPGMTMVPDFLERTGYRLPTEAEWEASARAGTASAQFYGSDQSVEILNLHSWNFHNAKGSMHPVGQMIPNAFGLFDVLGNAYELCHDKFGDYSPARNGPTVDNALPSETIDAGSWRVFRGGAFHRTNDKLRSAERNHISAVPLVDERSELVGFRVARTIRLEP